MNSPLAWPEADYRVDLPHPVPDDLLPFAAAVFARAWRTALDRPGFALIRFAGPVGSHELRRVVLALAGAFPVRFLPERLGRFDQQVTTKYHRDGAPPRSLLLLGYEPARVRSRFFVADAHRAALAAGLGIEDYLTRFNPMTPAGEARLRPFVTEANVPIGEPFILAINNSQLPFDPSGANPLGVLHKGEIPEPDAAAARVINSVGLTVEGDPAGRPKTPAEVEHFLTRTDLD